VLCPLLLLEATHAVCWHQHAALVPLMLEQLHEIEKQQQRQASKDLKRWDARFALRTKPLAELRSLAQ
jgi:hypothetical protein